MLLLCIGADFKGDIRGTDAPKRWSSTPISMSPKFLHDMCICVCDDSI